MEDMGLLKDKSKKQDQDLNSYNKSHYLASVASYLGDYENAVYYSEEMAKTNEGAFDLDQQKVYISAYYNLVSKLRHSWRFISYKEKEEKEGKKMLLQIKHAKETQIIKICEKMIKLINEDILAKENLSEEYIVLFTKLKADYYRYMAEITHGHKLLINKQNAFNFYKEAYINAKSFDNLNPVKLNVALNYSVFLYEILNKRINAFFYAKEALFKALKTLKNLDNEKLTDRNMKDSLMCIENLNRNVDEWYKEEVGEYFKMDDDDNVEIQSQPSDISSVSEEVEDDEEHENSQLNKNYDENSNTNNSKNDDENDDNKISKVSIDKAVLQKNKTRFNL